MPSRSRKRSGGSGSGRSSGTSASIASKRSSNATRKRRNTMAEASPSDIRVPVARTAPDTIQLERILDAPVELVWRYLTEAELREKWFMGGTDVTGVGEFDLLVDHDKLSSNKVQNPE